MVDRWRSTPSVPGYGPGRPGSSELGGPIYTSPGYYPYHLFLDIRHTWLMPFLAVAGLGLWWRAGRERIGDMGYIVFWGLGLLLVLSFAVVSVSPFRLIYRTDQLHAHLCSPACVAGGVCPLRVKGKLLIIVLLLVISGSLVLGALEQQAIRVFTANSRAAFAFAAAHPDVLVFGTTNAENISTAVSGLHGRWPSRTNIKPLAELGLEQSADMGVRAEKSPAADPSAYVVLDMETLDWGKGDFNIATRDVPQCWQRVGTLEPQGFGIGKAVLGALRAGAEMVLPERVAQKALSATDSLYRPRPAYVYAIPAGCVARLGIVGHRTTDTRKRAARDVKPRRCPLA